VNQRVNYESQTGQLSLAIPTWYPSTGRHIKYQRKMEIGADAARKELY